MPSFTSVALPFAQFGGEPAGRLIESGGGAFFGVSYYGGAKGGMYSGYGSVYEVLPATSGGYTSSTLINFNGIDGANPTGALVADAAGNLFGVTYTGGSANVGTLYEIAKTAAGYAAAPATLVTFNGSNGALPDTSLVIDAQGDLFGTTASGGPNGASTVYELALTNGSYAAEPVTLARYPAATTSTPIADAGLLEDAAGDLLGVTRAGGANGAGSVFEVAKTAAGYTGTPTTLVSFDRANGATPDAALIADASGNLFGTTSAGGASGAGTVFEIPYANGAYATTPVTLTSFDGANAGDPLGRLVIDAGGNLYGTTQGAPFVFGNGGYRAGQTTGTVFELARTGSGYASTPSFLYRFPILSAGTIVDPYTGLTVDAAGNFFGAASYSGVSQGPIYELSGTGFTLTAPVAQVTDGKGTVHTIEFTATAQATVGAAVLAGVAASSTLFVDTAGSVTMAGGQTGAVDDASGQVTVVGNAGAGQAIVAGNGDFAFAGGGGSGTLVAGSGNDNIFLNGSGDWSTTLGNGTDTVVAGGGNDSIATGQNQTIAFLGSGATSVTSAGNDSVYGGTGSATISAIGSNSDVVAFFDAPLTFLAGAGASTVIAGTMGGTITGGSGGGSLIFSFGALNYQGAGAADTVAGVQGSITVQGGAGGGEYFVGPGGNNRITTGTGNVTAIGGGAGDVLTATGKAGAQFGGGAGAETLSGAGSTGNDVFFAGSGPETLIGGGGFNYLAAGAGDALLDAGSGSTTFLFYAGRTAGGSDTITGFNAAHDHVTFYGQSAAAALRTAVVANGSTAISLQDGTHVLFAGLAQLSTGSFS